MEIIDRLSANAETPEFKAKIDIASSWLRERHIVESKIISRKLGNGIAAAESCISAVYLALAFREKTFTELLEDCKQLGGDVDTISAMAGAIWGAARGIEELPEKLIEELEQFEQIKTLAESLSEAK